MVTAEKVKPKMVQPTIEKRNGKSYQVFRNDGPDFANLNLSAPEISQPVGIKELQTYAKEHNSGFALNPRSIEGRYKNYELKPDLEVKILEQGKEVLIDSVGNTLIHRYDSSIHGSAQRFKEEMAEAKRREQAVLQELTAIKNKKQAA